MADRIVVMNHGRIEQIGTPAEVYGAPVTPFVADFVGKTNQLPATRLAADRVRIGRHEFGCTVDPALAGTTALQVFFRPEDLVVRGVGEATPNAAAAIVEAVEFMGAFSRLTVRLEGIDADLVADLSVNDLAEFRPRPGDRLRMAVPADRLRVFAAA